MLTLPQGLILIIFTTLSMFGIRIIFSENLSETLPMSEVPDLSISEQSISGAVVMNSYYSPLILYYFSRSKTPTPSPAIMHLLPVGRPGVSLSGIDWRRSGSPAAIAAVASMAGEG